MFSAPPLTTMKRSVLESGSQRSNIKIFPTFWVPKQTFPQALRTCIVAMFVCRRNPKAPHAHKTRGWEWRLGKISSIREHKPCKRSTFIPAWTYYHLSIFGQTTCPKITGDVHMWGQKQHHNFSYLHSMFANHYICGVLLSSVCRIGCWNCLEFIL